MKALKNKNIATTKTCTIKNNTSSVKKTVI